MPQVPVGSSPVQVWAGQSGVPVLLANQDTSATVTISTSSSIAPDGSNGDPVPPLGSVVMDGSKTLYAVASAAVTAPLLVTAGGTAWTPSPAQAAAQIAASGLALNTTVQATNGQLASGIPSPVPVLLAPAQSFPAGPWTFSGNIQFPAGGAYEIQVNIGSHVFYATDITVEHLDSTGTIVLYDETFTVHNCAAGNGAGPATVTIRGNLHGSQLALSGVAASSGWLNTVMGVSPAGAGGPSISVYGIGGLPSAAPKVSSGGTTGVLGFNETATLAASTTTRIAPLPSYSGRAYMQAYTAAGGGFEFTPLIQCYTVANGTSPLYTMRFSIVEIAPGLTSTTPFALDYSAHWLSALNNSTVSTQPALMNVVPADFI